MAEAEKSRSNSPSPGKSSDEARRRKAEEAEVRVGWQMAGIGMTVASEVAAGVLIGWAIDLWRGHGRTGVIVGTIIGISVGMWTLIQNTLKLNRQLERTAPTAGRGRPIADDQWNDEDKPDDDDWNQRDDQPPRSRQPGE